jgi:hypothetical protein
MADASVAENVAWLDGMVQLATQATKVVGDAGLPVDSPQTTRAALETLVPVVQSVRVEMEKQGGTGNGIAHLLNQPAGQLRQAQAQVSSLQGQLRNVQRMLEGAGRGTEKPACWASPESGKPKYIFAVALTSTGIVVRDNALPHRSDEQRQLPLSPMIFGRFPRI